MNVAVQTISWGHEPQEGVREMLHTIKAIGYDGIELWQHPDVLQREFKANPAKELLATLEKIGLKLLGVSSGSLSEKIEFVTGLIRAEQFANIRAKKAREWVCYSPSKRKPYVWLDGWHQHQAQQALDNELGYTLALHPAMFKPVQTLSEAEDLLKKYPKLRFIPDTGHLTVAGEKLIEVLERTFDRLEAVHLKDWHAEYGRAAQFYSHGFTELGQGDVDLDSVLQYLTERGFAGWLVVDQSKADDPGESAKISRDWLRSRGV